MALTEGIFKLEDAVQWHEGLLLYPQHFQQLRGELRQVALCYLTMASPFYWGIRYLKLDEAALAAGVVSINEILAVMPDGCIIWKDATLNRPIELDIRHLKDKIEGKELKIHLAVIKIQENSKTVGGEYGRYESLDGEPVVDENTGENPIPLPRIALRVFLLEGDEHPARFTTFPLIGVTLRDDVFVKTDFIPPSTNIRKDSAIGELCESVIKSLRTRVSFLSERLQAPYNQDTATLLDQYEKIYNIICSRLLGLEAVFYAEGSHPFAVFREMCMAAGVFCGLNTGQLPPIFEPYNHNDLRATFTPVINFVEKMIENVKNPCVSMAFEKEGRVFSRNIKKEWMDRGYLAVGIKLGSDLTPKEATDWIQGAVIVSESMVNDAKDKRILGTARQVVDQISEMGLMMTRDKILIKVDVDPKHIVPNERLQIFNLSDSEKIRPGEIILYTNT